jgi:hypothetical protein
MKLLICAAAAALAGCGPLQASPSPADAPATPHIDLTVQIDIETESLIAQATISAPRRAWDAGWVLNSALTVGDLPSGWMVTSHEQDDLSLLALDSGNTGDPAEILTARFEYAGVLSRDVMPFPLDRIAADAVELSANSMWLPVHASLSETYTIEAVISGVPEAWTLIAPGVVTRQPGGGWRIEREAPDLDLAFFAAHGLDCLEAGALQLCGHTLDTPHVEVIAQHGSASLEMFTDLFGPAEVATTKIALVERDRSGGYARAGYMVMDIEDDDTERHLASYVAHEFAHSWFLPPIGSPDDHWLVESPAEYAAWRYMEAAYGPEARVDMETTARSRMLGAGPLSGAGRASHAALYNAGPVFLADLEARIGRDALDTILRRTLADPVMTTAGFLEAVGTTAGPDAESWARERIYAE